MKLAFTVVSVSFLGTAKIMADSLRKHNPDYHVVFGIVDKIEGRIDQELFKNYELIEIDKIGISGFEELLKKYNIYELCSMSKCFFAEYLLKKYPQIAEIIYIDADVLVFDSFAHIETELQSNDIILSPHILSPYNDFAFPRETFHLNVGVFNGGFFALRRSPETWKFLDWWQNRLRHFGYENLLDGMFMDQLWLNFVPLFFKNVLVEQHLGINCAYWNIHERQFSVNKEGKFVVNNEFPLIFFHYSGYKTLKPNDIATMDRYNLENRPDLRPIFKIYHDSLIEIKAAEFQKLPNLLLGKPAYLKYGKLRDFALRVARKTLRMLHG